MKATLVAAIFLGTCCMCFGQQITVTGRVELSSNNPHRSSDLSGTVVWLTALGDAPRIQSVLAQPRAQLLQKKKTFSPHLLVIPVGSPVEFPNQDPFFHNVFSLFEGKRFDLGLYEAGTSRSMIFNRPGISYIFCNIHPDMSAVVITLQTPYYAISDHNGDITIPGVPGGSYHMEVWHERVLPETLNGFKRRLEISPVSSSLGVIHLTEQRNVSQPHRNKYGRDYDNPPPNAGVYTRP